MNSPHKGQWCGALMFSLICAWIKGWINNREAGDLRRHRTHYDVIGMFPKYHSYIFSWNVYCIYFTSHDENNSYVSCGWATVCFTRIISSYLENDVLSLDQYFQCRENSYDCIRENALALIVYKDSVSIARPSAALASILLDHGEGFYLYVKF